MVDFNSDFDAERDALLDQIKACADNAPPAVIEALDMRLGTAVNQLHTASDKVDFLEDLLSDSGYNKASCALVTQHMDYVYRDCVELDTKIQCAYYIARYSDKTQLQSNVLDFLAGAYHGCSQNDLKVDALTVLLLDHRNTLTPSDDQQAQTNVERQKRYFDDWKNGIAACNDADKSRKALQVINKDQLYDTFKLDCASLVYDHVGFAKDPLHQINCIMICNSKIPGWRNEPENHKMWRVDPLYWPTDKRFDWQSMLLAACRKSVARIGIDATLDHMKSKTDRYGYQPWVTEFYNTAQANPDMLKSVQTSQVGDNMTISQAMKSNFKLDAYVGYNNLGFTPSVN